LGAIALCAILCEAAILVIALVLRPLGQGAIDAGVLAGSFTIPLLFALWVGSRSRSWFVVQGLLIGAIAVLLYLGLLAAVRAFGPPQPPEPFAYTIAHGLKLLGGALGGLIASRRAVAGAGMGSGVA
jgi:hypothetical protein